MINDGEWTRSWFGVIAEVRSEARNSSLFPLRNSDGSDGLVFCMSNTAIDLIAQKTRVPVLDQIVEDAAREFPL